MDTLIFALALLFSFLSIRALIAETTRQLGDYVQWVFYIPTILLWTWFYWLA